MRTLFTLSSLFIFLLSVSFTDKSYTSGKIDHRIHGQLQDTTGFDAPTQVFTIYDSIPQTLIGIQGTEIDIPAHSLWYSDRKDPNKTDPITIKMWEYCKTSTLATYGLTTLADDQLLNCTGTIYIEALCGDKRLRLKPNAYLTIHFPKKQGQDTTGVRLFAGQEENDDYSTNWFPYPPQHLKLLPDGQTWGVAGTADASVHLDSLGRMVLMSGILKHITCAAYYSVAEKQKTTITLRLNCTDTSNINTFLVFKELHCIVPGKKTGEAGRFVFEGMPKGKNAVLVAKHFAFRPMAVQLEQGLRDIVIGERNEEYLDLKPVTEAQYKKQLLSLDTIR